MRILSLCFCLYALISSSFAFARVPASGPTTKPTTGPMSKVIPVESAERQCDATIKEAQAIEKTTKLKAYKQLLGVLESSMKAELKAGNLKNANVLSDKIQEIRDQVDVLNGVATQLIVYGNRGWQEFGPVTKDQKLKITVAGQWTDDSSIPERTCGPEGLQGRWKLIAQINEHNSFDVGKALELVAGESGELRFGMNDSGHLNGGGSLVITIRLAK